MTAHAPTLIRLRLIYISKAIDPFYRHGRVTYMGRINECKQSEGGV